MKREQVDSSNISSIGYAEESNTLEIEFHGGAVYQYFDVPSHVHDGIMGPGSKGQYFAQHIKGYFRYAKV
jgi:uncharacterized protein